MPVISGLPHRIVRIPYIPRGLSTIVWYAFRDTCASCGIEKEDIHEEWRVICLRMRALDMWMWFIEDFYMELSKIMKYCFKHGDFEGDKCPKCHVPKPSPTPEPEPETIFDKLRKEYGDNKNVESILNKAEKMRNGGKI